ncbi:MAG: hypothetical protein QOF62_3256 [Pyrinomonadaceae bacterium]|jgi:CSLREA domain-containing protein|nr:hypothetical protein [Pyrinomonadaceae bacterium]
MKHGVQPSASRLFRPQTVCGVFLIAIFAYLVATPPSALMMATFTVNSPVDSVDALPGNGVCADALGRCTLRAAIMEANALPGADIISVPAGIYTLTLPAGVTPLPTYDRERLLSTGANQSGGDLDILAGNLTIVGASASTTIIQAGATTATGIDRIFDVNNAKGGPGIGIDVTLQNLTLRNGNSPTETPPTPGIQHAGGAIQFDGFDVTSGLPKGKLTITNCVISSNQASGTGGAIKVSFGSLDIAGTTISSNTSLNASGGAIMFDAGAASANQTLSITNSTISGNSAPNGTFGSGGGVFATGNASFTFQGNTLTSNSAGADGGAIAAIGFSAAKAKTITKNRIENNSATRGDGVFSGNSSASVSPLTFTLNVVVGNQTGASDATRAGLYSTTNTGGDLVANNWWGCNEGPNSGSCDRIAGAVGFGSLQWLVLSHVATPNSIPVNSSTTLQADFFTPNSGSAVPASDLIALNGRAISFSNAMQGIITGADTQISGGKANAIFTAGPTGGTGSADATVDFATVTAYITIEQAPNVTVNPSNQTACEGSSVSFTAASSGLPPPTVQWQVSTGGPFTDIPGATSNTLTFTAAASQNGNQYRAVFTNSSGSDTTTAATLTVNTSPAVTTNPSNTTVCDGATATFSAAATGSPAPTVQWQVSSGGPFSDIPGATNTSLSFTANTAQNGNQYRAVFTNTCGSATTTAATLTVSASATTSDPADQTVCEGTAATFSTTAGGSGPFTYAWTVDGSPYGGDTSSISVTASVGNHTVTVTTTGACGSASQSATLTVNASTTTSDPADQTVCEGTAATFSTTATGSNLHYAWTVDGSPYGGDTSSISVTASVGNHTVAVTTTGTCGTASQSATLTVNANTTTSDPADQTVCEGTAATFSTTAGGTGPFTYAWTVDGSPYGGDTSSISVTASVGNHTVAVTTTGTCGTASQSATLTVNASTTTSDPADQTVCEGTAATFSTTATGTNLHYAWTVDGASYGGDTSSISVTASVGSHTVAVTTTGTCGTASESATLTVNAPATTSDPSDQTVCQGATASFSTTAGGTGPFTYAWTVDGSPAGTNSPNLAVDTTSLSVGNHTVTVTTTGACGSASQSATLSVQANTSTTDPPDQTVCQGAMASFSTTASGTGPFHYAWTVDGTSFGGDTSSINVATGSLSVGNHTVTVTTSGTCGSASQSATLTVNANTTTSDPADVAACEGATASFTTNASGTGPFSFVWKKGAVPIVSGGRFTITNTSTSSTLTIGNVQAGDAGSYTVETTGACGMATQSANLSVDSSPPVIILNGNNITLWPPNHQYRTINATDLVSGVTDSCESLSTSSVTIASVTSDEVEDAPSGGDGNTLNDIVISCDRHSVKLRQERDGNLNGRVYTIVFTVTDSQGHVGTATAKVSVPVNQNGAAAVDSGPHYAVATATCP